MAFTICYLSIYRLNGSLRMQNERINLGAFNYCTIVLFRKLKVGMHVLNTVQIQQVQLNLNPHITVYVRTPTAKFLLRQMLT
jgi:hypothetical protein